MNRRRLRFFSHALLLTSLIVGTAPQAPTAQANPDSGSPLLFTATIENPDAAKLKRFGLSPLKSAQEICLEALESRVSKAVEPWAILVKFSSAKLSSAKLSGNSLSCTIPYFLSRESFKKSILSLLETSLDTLPYVDQTPAPLKFPPLMAKLKRLAEEPYVSIEIQNRDPRGNQPQLRSKLERLSDIQLDLEDRVAVVPLENGKLLIPIDFKGQIKLQLPDTNHELTLPSDELQFPENFLWGTATAAHQIEGGNHASDWWALEQKTGAIFDGSHSDQGPDHWNLWKDDLEILKQMFPKGGTYRMSLEWAKIEPTYGAEKPIFNEAVMSRYQEEIQALLANGIEPIVTLHHFTVPAWFRNAELGFSGWESPKASAVFSRFAEYVYRKLAEIDPGNKIKRFVSFNEPMPHIFAGYVSGVHPPEIVTLPRVDRTQAPLVGLLKAHVKVREKLREVAQSLGRTVQVGMAHRIDVYAPLIPTNPLHQQVAKVADDVFNWAIPNAFLTGTLEVKANLRFDLGSYTVQIPELKGTQDFFGLNYYYKNGVAVTLSPPSFTSHASSDDTEVTEMGWGIFPEGLYTTLKTIQARFQDPEILILENGIGDSRDRLRPRYLRNHLVYLHQAIQEKVRVSAYCHWSLLDNFEWEQGIGIRFGLFSFNPLTKKREARTSAIYYTGIASGNALPLLQRP